jgi:hypothetical protein
MTSETQLTGETRDANEPDSRALWITAVLAGAIYWPISLATKGECINEECVTFTLGPSWLVIGAILAVVLITLVLVARPQRRFEPHHYYAPAYVLVWLIPAVATVIGYLLFFDIPLDASNLPLFPAVEVTYS